MEHLRTVFLDPLDITAWLTRVLADQLNIVCPIGALVATKCVDYLTAVLLDPMDIMAWPTRALLDPLDIMACLTRVLLDPLDPMAIATAVDMVWLLDVLGVQLDKPCLSQLVDLMVSSTTL